MVMVNQGKDFQKGPWSKDTYLLSETKIGAIDWKSTLKIAKFNYASVYSFLLHF